MTVALCSVGRPGEPLEQVVANKVRLTFPAPNRPNLGSEALALARLEGARIERGPLSADVRRPDGCATTRRPLRSWSLEGGELNATLVHDLGDAGLVHERYTVHREPGDDRPVNLTDAAEVRWHYQPDPDAELVEVVGCAPSPTMYRAAEATDGEWSASLEIFVDDLPRFGWVYVQRNGQAFAYATAMRFWALTEADVDGEEHYELDFTLDQEAWQVALHHDLFDLPPLPSYGAFSEPAVRLLRARWSHGYGPEAPADQLSLTLSEASSPELLELELPVTGFQESGGPEFVFLESTATFASGGGGVLLEMRRWQDYSCGAGCWETNHFTEWARLTAFGVEYTFDGWDQLGWTTTHHNFDDGFWLLDSEGNLFLGEDCSLSNCLFRGFDAEGTQFVGPIGLTLTSQTP